MACAAVWGTTGWRGPTRAAARAPLPCAQRTTAPAGWPRALVLPASCWARVLASAPSARAEEILSQARTPAPALGTGAAAMDCSASVLAGDGPPEAADKSRQADAPAPGQEHAGVGGFGDFMPVPVGTVNEANDMLMLSRGEARVLQEELINSNQVACDMSNSNFGSTPPASQVPTQARQSDKPRRT